jgi:hypothetical protein
MVLCVLRVQNGSIYVGWRWARLSTDKDMFSFWRNAIQKQVCVEGMKLSCFIASYNVVQIQKRNYARFCMFADFLFLEFQFNLFFVAFLTDGWPEADIFVVLYLTGVRNFYYVWALWVYNGAECDRKVLYFSFVHIDLTHCCLCIKIRK